jgi:sporulation protein YabP
MAEGRHKLMLDERRELLVSGVQDVESFDDARIELNSTLGGIDIGGSGLKIAALNLDEGKITISGQIDSIAYVQSRGERSIKHKSKNALGRLLK